MATRVDGTENQLGGNGHLTNKLNSTFESTCIKLLFLLFGIFCLVQNESIDKKKLLQKNRPLILSVVIMIGNSDHFI